MKSFLVTKGLMLLFVALLFSCGEEPMQEAELMNPKGVYCCQTQCRRGSCSVAEGAISCTCTCIGGFPSCTGLFGTMAANIVSLDEEQVDNFMDDIEYLTSLGEHAEAANNVMIRMFDLFRANGNRLVETDALQRYSELLNEFRVAIAYLSPDELDRID